MLTITGIEWNARDSRLFERYPSPLDSVRERSKVSIVGFPSFRGPASILLSGGGDLFLCWSFLAAGVEAVFLRVLHLGHDLPRLAAGIVMVGVSRRLQLWTSLPAFSRHELVLVHVVLFQIVRHGGADQVSQTTDYFRIIRSGLPVFRVEIWEMKWCGKKSQNSSHVT